MVCSLLSIHNLSNTAQHISQNENTSYPENTPPWQLLFVVPIVILCEIYFDECIMRRKPWIGSALGGLSLLALTIVTVCEPLKERLKIKESMTTFIILKAYLLTVPAFLLPTFRCIHGPESQFNKFKRQVCLNLKWIKHKMGNPGIVSLIMYAFLVSNIAEAVIFEFMLPWNDWRDSEEKQFNVMTTLTNAACLLNAICGFLVILMIPLPKNWHMFSEVDESGDSVDAMYDIASVSSRNSMEVSQNGDKKVMKMASSEKYNDLHMVLQQNPNSWKLFAYWWIFTYSSWNWQFTTRYLGSSSFIHGPVHLIPPIIRCIVNGRTDLWVQSRLHVLWSAVIVWVPLSNLIGISTKKYELNTVGMFIWALVNLVASVSCFMWFVSLKWRQGNEVDLNQENDPNESGTSEEEMEDVV